MISKIIKSIIVVVIFYIVLLASLVIIDANEISQDINISNDEYYTQKFLQLSDICEDSLDMEIDLYRPSTDIRYIQSELAVAISRANSIDIKSFKYNDVVEIILPIPEEGQQECLLYIDGNEYVIERKHLSYNKMPDRELISSSAKKHKRNNTNNKYYAGLFQLTAYAWTGNPCANGRYPRPNYTVAAHRSDFPLGTKLYITGYGEFTVEDRGAFKRGVIDIYLGDKAKCIKFGRKHTVKVYVIKYGKK